MFGISGYARTGKDTFGEALVKILSEYGIKAKTFALATELKKTLDNFTYDEFGISAFTKDDKEKNIIRPILVGYGESCRRANPNHWINVLKDTFSENYEFLPIVTDIRYENEAEWILSSKNSFLLNINRMISETEMIQPANEEEKLNSPKVSNKASFLLTWYTCGDQKEIENMVESFIISVLQQDKLIESWKATYPL